MKVYRECEVKHRAFLTSALYGGGWLALYSRKARRRIYASSEK
jgi:hypothetical protein